MLDLNALKNRKGELSRQIGTAKKNGEPIDDLLSEMKEVSAKLKALETEQKEKAALARAGAESKNKSNTPVPQQFAPKSDSGVKPNQVRLANDSDSVAWDAYVDKTKGSSIYHLWCFKKLIETTFGHSTHYFMALDQSGNVIGVCPTVELSSPLFGHFLVSIPFFNYGAPLGDSEIVENELCKASFDHARQLGAEHVELRSMHQRSELLEKQNKVSMVRSLPDSSEQLWSDIGTKVRAQIKKADRYNLSIKFGKEELVDDYYRVFAENMRDLGTPVYSKSLFKNLFTKSLIESSHVVVVYCGSKPVSAGILLGHKDTLEIPWASTLRRANNMNANMFMYWNILSFAIDNGYRFFDFGRSSKDASTYKFKKQWGASPQQLYWHYWLASGDELPEINPNNPKYKLLIAVWQRLPIFIANLIGPLVVKYLP